MLTACFDRRTENEGDNTSVSTTSRLQHASETETTVSMATPHYRPTSPTISEASPVASGLRVLLVDDNSINLQVRGIIPPYFTVANIAPALESLCPEVKT